MLNSSNILRALVDIDQLIRSKQVPPTSLLIVADGMRELLSKWSVQKLMIEDPLEFEVWRAFALTVDSDIKNIKDLHDIAAALELDLRRCADNVGNLEVVKEALLTLHRILLAETERQAQHG